MEEHERGALVYYGRIGYRSFEVIRFNGGRRKYNETRHLLFSGFCHHWHRGPTTQQSTQHTTGGLCASAGGALAFIASQSGLAPAPATPGVPEFACHARDHPYYQSDPYGAIKDMVRLGQRVQEFKVQSSEFNVSCLASASRNFGTLNFEP